MQTAKYVFNDISLVITSSGRADLLAKTLASMQPWIYLIHERILIDDMRPGHTDISLLAREYGFYYFENEKPLGQHLSIDRAYQHVTNPYIFHCEDDWEFTKQPDFNLAVNLLSQPNISCVCLRKVNDRSRSKYPKRTIDTSRYESAEFQGKQYFTIKNNWHPAHGAFTFNPNLIKTELYNVIGPYRQYPTERAISALMKHKGYTIAFEPQGSCIHIGWNRHVQDPTKLPREHTFIGKLKRSCTKRFQLVKTMYDHLTHSHQQSK